MITTFITEEPAMNAQASDRIAQALLHELDVRFQQFYHQSLSDIVNDLEMHNVISTPRPSADVLVGAIRQTGLLSMNTAREVIAMREVVDRYARGTLNKCTRCGYQIAARDLEHNPLIAFCARCRRQATHDARGASS